MLKGVNKQILEITNTESPYFEKIIFFVRPESMNQTKSTLQNEAEKFALQNARPPKTRKSKKEKLTTFLFTVLGIGAGIALTVVMGLIS